MAITVMAVAITDLRDKMKFYDREIEIAHLREIEARSRETAQMTVVTGRRRIGKTALLTTAYPRALYFYVEKKNEALLCEDFALEIREKLNTPVLGSVNKFQDIFIYLMDLSATRHFTLIIDEFQDFQTVNPSIYSAMQHHWDMKKEKSLINLLLCGSVYSLMMKLFSGKEPLFGRASARITVRYFDIPVLKQILNDYYPKYTNEDLLALYMISGGVAKYVEALVNAKAFTLNVMLNTIFARDSWFLDEGRILLIDEFGKDYGTYYTILSLISSSKTSRTEMESIMGVSVGGFLDRLEHDFNWIRKIRPVFSKAGSRTVKYQIIDNFLNFWFRFVFKYRSAVELNNFKYLKEIAKRDYATYSGHILERYFTQKIAAEENLSELGAYWEKGNQNEIDIVGVNDLEKTAIIAEVKRQKKNIDINALKEKAKQLMPNLEGYDVQYRGLSINDM